MNTRKQADKSTVASAKVLESIKTKKANFGGVERTPENRPPSNQSLTNTFQFRKNSFVSSIKEIAIGEKRLFTTTSKSRSAVRKEGEGSRVGTPKEALNGQSGEQKSLMGRSKIGSQQDLNLYSVFRGVNLGKDKGGKEGESLRQKPSQIQIYKEALLPKNGSSSWFGKSLNQGKKQDTSDASIERRGKLGLKVESSANISANFQSTKSPLSSSLTKRIAKRSLIEGSLKTPSTTENKSSKFEIRASAPGKDDSLARSLTPGKPNLFSLSFGHSNGEFKKQHDMKEKPIRKLSSTVSARQDEIPVDKPTAVEFTQSSSCFYNNDPLTQTAPLGKKKSIGNLNDSANKSPFLSSKTEKPEPNSNQESTANDFAITTPKITNPHPNGITKAQKKLNKIIVFTSTERPTGTRVASCENAKISTRFQSKSKAALLALKDERCMSQEPDLKEGKSGMVSNLDPRNDHKSRTMRLVEEIAERRAAKLNQKKQSEFSQDPVCPPSSSRADDGGLNIVMTEYSADDPSVFVGQDALLAASSLNGEFKTPEMAPSNNSIKPSQIMGQKGSALTFQKGNESKEGSIRPGIETIQNSSSNKGESTPAFRVTFPQQNQSTTPFEYKPSAISQSDKNVELQYSPEDQPNDISAPLTNRSNFRPSSNRPSGQITVYESLREHLNGSHTIRALTQTIRKAFDIWESESPAPRGPFATLPECYKIHEQIGKGCFGTVHLATQQLTGLPVALKVVSKSSILKDRSSEKMKQEIRFLKTVSSEKYLAKLLEVFEDDRNVYIVLEYYPNGDLITFFKDRELLEEEDLQQLFLKIVLGVERLHRLSIIHRDIKMDNILLDKNFEPVISDFGISSFYDPEKPIMDTGGTPAYLAPEVIKATGGICFKTDVWGLGVLLYALAFGYVPFEGDDIQDLYRAIMIGRFQFPHRRNCSNELVDLISRMIVVDVRRRYGIADVLRHPWMAKAAARHAAMTSEAEKTVKIIERSKKEGIIRYLNDAGFGLDYIYDSIANRQFNHVTSCYENLMRN